MSENNTLSPIIFSLSNKSRNTLKLRYSQKLYRRINYYFRRKLDWSDLITGKVGGYLK